MLVIAVTLTTKTTKWLSWGFLPGHLQTSDECKSGCKGSHATKASKKYLHKKQAVLAKSNCQAQRQRKEPILQTSIILMHYKESSCMQYRQIEMLTFCSAYLQGKRFQRARYFSACNFTISFELRCTWWLGLKAGHETKKHLFRCFKVFAVAKQN